MDFEEIKTQEQLDSIIETKLKEANENHQKVCSDYDEQISKMTKEAQSNAKKINEYESKIGELQNKINTFEINSLKQKIASECGIPCELAARLSGADEKSIREDAERLAVHFKKPVAPLKSENTSYDTSDSKKDALKKLLSGLTGN